MYRETPVFAPEEILEYLRKSQSDDPDLTVDEVLAKHEEILDEFAIANFGGVIPPENRFKEVESGETIAGRPAFQELLRKIESPKYKAILVVEVQRLSRGDLEDAGRLIKILRYTNTMVITKRRTYDLRDEDDRDAFERELKRGNEYLEYQKKIMMRGREASVRAGNFIGSIAPYGYRKITITEGKKKCHTLEPDPIEAPVVRMIFEWYVNENLGRVTIAHRLNEMGIKPRVAEIWQQEAIKGILENDHYIGKVRWNWKKTMSIVEEGEIRKVRPRMKVGEYLLYDGRHEALVSDELFQAARDKQGRNTKEKKSSKIRNPLAGLVFCQCGRAMSLRTYKKDGVERSAPRMLCDNQAYCKTSSALYDEILDAVVKTLEQCIEDFEIRVKEDNSDSIKLHTSLVKQLEEKMKKLQAKELLQWEQQSDPDPEKRMPEHVFKQLNAKLLLEKEEVQQALCKAYESMPEPVNYEEKILRFRDALNALRDPDAEPKKKNTLLKACIERITYNREKSVILRGKKGKQNGLKRGANWSNPPIELDIKLRL